MNQQLSQKIQTLISGCDSECQRKRDIDKLKKEYTSYLNKYLSAYNDYQIKKYGSTLSQKEIQKDHDDKLKGFTNKMEYIEKVLKEDINEANSIISYQEKMIKEKNKQIQSNKLKQNKRKKILKDLTDNLLTDNEQLNTFDNEKHSIIPHIRIPIPFTNGLGLGFVGWWAEYLKIPYKILLGLFILLDIIFIILIINILKK